ncbi:T9SS type A sorting domain-containing protein, partial [bacterium]|nr:T9SS type A sorting domain-containing protein [bacterium]
VVFEGLGGGAFGPWLTLATSGSPSALVVADLDGGGAPDIAVLCSDGWLDRFLNVGAGAFTPSAAVPTNYGGNDLVVAHFDGDGVLDAAVRTYANVVAVHAGGPGGAFGPARGYGTVAGGSALLVEDFDGDANLDLLVAGWGHPELNLLRNSQGGGSSAVGDGPLFATGVLDMGHAAPNPASGGTQLEFRLGAAQRVAVDVFDLRGRLVRSLLAGRDLGEGSHVLHWDLTDRDGARVPSGVYLARVRAGDAAATRKVFVTR